jgi:hypothetical protein
MTRQRSWCFASSPDPSCLAAVVWCPRYPTHSGVLLVRPQHHPTSPTATAAARPAPLHPWAACHSV